MDKGKKRERNVNFSREETEKFVCLVESYKNVIENKKSDAVTWQEKEKAWKAIEIEFNRSIAGIYRDAKHLKLKYEALKRDTRKKICLIRSECYKTGDGVSGVTLLTPVEQKVKEMIMSDEGDESIVREGSDSHQVGNVGNGKQREKRPFDKLAEAKIELVALQKQIIEKELEERLLKKQMMNMEMEHNKEMYKLEREERFLKIEILKRQLENKIEL